MGVHLNPFTSQLDIVDSPSGDFTDLTLNAGTAAAPSISFDGDTNTGIYSPGGDQLALSTNGTGRLFVDASGRVGIGTSVPDSPLQVIGSTSAHFKRTDNGTSAILITGNDKQWSLGVHSDDYFRITREGVGERLRITSAGLVGIGTSAPLTLLHLSSETGTASPTPTSLRIATTSSAADWSTVNPWGRIEFFNHDTSNSGPKIHAAIDAVCAGAGGGVSNLQLKTNNAAGALNTVLTATYDGNVGIGTTSPDSSLVVTGGAIRSKNVDGDSGFDFYENGSAALIRQRNNRAMLFYTNNTEAARIDSSGRLLVGTSTSADQNARIQSATDSVNVFEGFQHGANTFGAVLRLAKSRGAIGTTALVSDDDELGRVGFLGSDETNYRNAASIAAFVDGTPGANDMPGRLVFSTTADGASSPGTRMTIKSTGEINLATPLSGYIFNAGSAVTTWRFGTKAGAGPYYVVNNSGTGVQLGNNATSWTTASDERKKENLVPIVDGLNKVGTLRACTGKYINDEPGTSRSFLIAQDVQAVLPEAVDDTDANDLGVRYTEVIPLLVAALKESKERIETLEAKVAALESA